MALDQTQLFLWIVALIVTEIFHLKWIVWTEWSCRKCSRKHKDCACEGIKWFLLL